MRGDREYPPERWFQALSDVTKRYELEPIVVVQVERDGDRASMIADRLAGGVLAWDPIRTRHERNLRQTYREADVVITDRLHVFVLAAVEGALPLCLTSYRQRKLESVLGAVKLGHHVADLGGLEVSGRAPEDFIADRIDEREHSLQIIAEAAIESRQAERAILALFSRDRGRSL
ncbi:hypothetical protein GCM10023199_34350 [Actinomycetospora chibensis]